MIAIAMRARAPLARLRLARIANSQGDEVSPGFTGALLVATNLSSQNVCELKPSRPRRAIGYRLFASEPKAS
jgi:hypothetical protein